MGWWWPFFPFDLSCCFVSPVHHMFSGGLKVLATTRRPDFKPPTPYYCSRFVILFCKPADHSITVAGHIIRRDWVSRNVPLSHLSLLFSGRQQRNTMGWDTKRFPGIPAHIWQQRRCVCLSLAGFNFHGLSRDSLVAVGLVFIPLKKKKKKTGTEK